MRTGYNLQFSVIRNENLADSDDVVGGAQITGSLVYSDVPGFLQMGLPDQVFLAQGLETNKMFRLTVGRPDLDIRERDYIVVTSPPNHKYYNQNLRVVSVAESNYTDMHRRGSIIDLTRDTRAHSIQ